MEYVYHGSHKSGITRLEPVSPLHAAPDTKVVYLSGNEPYSLFYIWDAQRNRTPRKHVTCGLRSGVVHYQEQFPGQLEAFYKGVSGYLYHIEKTPDMIPVAEREEMWACPHAAEIARTAFIPDVYAEIMRHVRSGSVLVTQADEDFKRQLDEHLAAHILAENLLAVPQSPDARFHARFFPNAWALAQDKSGL